MIIRGKSPLRISLAGGGTDLNHIFEKYGGAVVSTTIDKFCHMTLEKRDDNLGVVNEKSLKLDYIQKEDLVKAIIKKVNPEFGFNLTYYNDIQPGSGLGNSSSFTILLLRLLNEMSGKRVDDFELIKEAWVIEESFKLHGWQDQNATTFGGFNFMEFGDKSLIYPLRLKYSFLCELNEHLVLFKYLEGDKKGVDIHKKEKENLQDSDLKKMSKMKDLAIEMKDCLLNQNIKDIGKILHKGWLLKRNKFNTDKEIDNVYQRALNNGAIGGKLCGSGKAGHFLFFVKPENKLKLIKSLIKCQVVNFNFTNQGTETWRVE